MKECGLEIIGIFVQSFIWLALEGHTGFYQAEPLSISMVEVAIRNDDTLVIVFSTHLSQLLRVSLNRIRGIVACVYAQLRSLKNMYILCW